VEKEDHYYRAAHTKLLDLGLVPHLLNQGTLSSILSVAERHRQRVDMEAIRPTVNWRKTASSLLTAGAVAAVDVSGNAAAPGS
jgi:UDP-sulfoquinovose synthase